MTKQHIAEQLEKIQEQYDEITEWLIDSDFNHPEWDKQISKRVSLELEIEKLQNDLKYK